MSAILRNAAVAAFIAGVLAAPAWAATERAYIGTYTADPAQKRSNNHGEGIYLVDVDSATGALSNVRLVAKTPSPSWITLSPDGKFLYAGNEIGNFNGTKSGSVSAFASRQGQRQADAVECGEFGRRRTCLCRGASVRPLCPVGQLCRRQPDSAAGQA